MIRNKIYFLLTVFCLTFIFPLKSHAANEASTVSTKKERNLITKGNQYYKEGKFKQAETEYRQALNENPASIVGRYNLGLSQLKMGTIPGDTTQAARNFLESGVKNMEQIANIGKSRPDLASRANYNLGNVSFTQEDYQKAISYYKQALRLNPEDNDARRNLRIAQLKIQNQEDNQDQNQDQDQEQEQEQDQEQDQDQNQDQEQEQNQDQNQDQNEDEQNQDQQPQDINQQTAEQILNAIENKENQTRAKVAGNNAEKSKQRDRSRLNW